MMTKNEFLNLIETFIEGRLPDKETEWRFLCNLMTIDRAPNGKTEIRIQYKPVKVGPKTDSKG